MMQKAQRVVATLGNLYICGIWRRGERARCPVVIEIEVSIASAKRGWRAHIVARDSARDFHHLVCAENGVDLGQVCFDFLRVPLREATGYDQALAGTRLLEPGSLEDGIDRFPLGVLDEAAGVDDDDLGFRPVRGQDMAFLLQKTCHDLAVDKVLGTSQTDETDFRHGLPRGTKNGRPSEAGIQAATLQTLSPQRLDCAVVVNSCQQSAISTQLPWLRAES